MPVPEPSAVLLFAVVGLGFRLQHTPRAVTLAPPSEDTFPPLVAVIRRMFEAAVVEIIGGTGAVTKVSWLPYEVPELFVA
jgi:hypothetical protein